MILSKAYLRRRIREGTAVDAGIAYDNDGFQYVIVKRLDIHRTDHYLAYEPEGHGA